MAGKRIFIIDDDAELCEELSELLKSENYSVTFTSDTAHAKTYLDGKDFDVILLDYKMPGMTGADLLKNRLVKKRNVLIFSGRPFVENILRQEGVMGQVIGVISKPIDFNALLDRIKGAVSEEKNQ